jgi:hypothetical protein
MMTMGNIFKESIIIKILSLPSIKIFKSIAKIAIINALTVSIIAIFLTQLKNLIMKIKLTIIVLPQLNTSKKETVVLQLKDLVQDNKFDQ